MSYNNYRYFMLNNISVEGELRRVQSKLGFDLGPTHRAKEESEQLYYPQFSERVRAEAEKMANSYIIFYSLENSIRDLIADVLSDKHGTDWWSKPDIVPDIVAKNADSNKKKELGTGVTLRSSRMLDYTNFGELGEIIKTNWDDFADVFRDKRAVERMIANLNTLRSSIAHCTPLAEDEEVRLHLSLKDWFRQQA